MYHLSYDCYVYDQKSWVLEEICPKEYLEAAPLVMIKAINPAALLRRRVSNRPHPCKHYGGMYAGMKVSIGWKVT